MGLYDGKTSVFEHTLRHKTEELAPFARVGDQYNFRMELIERELDARGIKTEELAAVVGMGGLLSPLAGGTYLVNDVMKADLSSGKFGEHASNLGGLIARAMADKVGIPSYIVDPVVVDEMEEVFRISGHPLVPRRSVFHALNQKATARNYCEEHGKKYDEVNLVVVHMGGGISVSLHSKGRTIDTNNALAGCGPFTPERAGGLPIGDTVALAFDGNNNHDDIKKMLVGKGGMNAYFNTNDMMEIETRASKEPDVKLVLDAMCLQIAKSIAEMSVGVCGQVDAIILTGGIAHGKPITDEIARRVGFIAPVHVYPGEDEIAALANGARRVLEGEEKAMIYAG